MKRKTYYEQLKDPRWQKKAAEIKEMRGWKCQVCGDDTKQLSVHHSFYKRNTYLWDYPDWSLRCLCGGCHEHAQSEMEAAHEFIAQNGLFSFLAILSNGTCEESALLQKILWDVSMGYSGDKEVLLATLNYVSTNMVDSYCQGLDGKK